MARYQWRDIEIGRRFVRTTQAKNQVEAEYRYSLARVRENAECIALLRGAAAERASIDKSFGALLTRWTALVGQQMRAVIVSQGHAQLVRGRPAAVHAEIPRRQHEPRPDDAGRLGLRHRTGRDELAGP
jgi:ABC-type uncharacterized transport system fused permease/ATPase subunit